MSYIAGKAANWAAPIKPACLESTFPRHAFLAGTGMMTLGNTFALSSIHRLCGIVSLAAAICLLGILAGPRDCVFGADESKTDLDEGMRWFEARIRPVLARQCYPCHSTEANKSEGGLKLDSREALRRGGGRGPAIVPGKPEDSLLVAAISHADPDLHMPPKSKRLPDAVIADIQKWIQMAAPDPRTGPPGASPVRRLDISSAQQFWSFQKPVRAQLPEVEDRSWPKRDLDHFILAKLESEGLRPTEDASPAVFLRRLHFDLTGLPPSPDDVRRFRERIDELDFDAALRIEVDALLASRQFAECWGRHWLDVARFAESSGKEANISFPHAWRYRDYVIDCMDEDKPYDRFLVEQVAGDLLPYETSAERARLLIATGFLALGPKNLDEANGFQFLADVIDEQIDAVSRAVMANSIACARCHDHKFDPYTMEDYYALAGVFASTQTYFGTAISPANRVGGDPLVLPRDADQHIFHRGLSAEQVQKLKAELAALERERQAGVQSLREALRIFWRSGAIDGQLDNVDDKGDPLPLAMGVLDREQMINVPLLERGEIGRPTKPIPRGFPRVISFEDAAEVPDSQSGRLEFAKWLTYPDHPLTARVMANRIWHHLFGTGIVRTVDNFGVTGEPPSHPQLLDHLALQFVEQGWSVKRLVREIVLSRTYRQASTFDEQAFLKDPENRWRWRADKRRLDAESIRDAMLVASGELNLAPMPGSLVARQIGDRPVSLVGLDPRIPSDLDGSVHRSVYLPVMRDKLPDVFELFDFAEPSLVTGDRDTTNVPMQALYLLNSSFVHERSVAFADRLLRIRGEDEGRAWQERIRMAFLICFARLPEETEISTSLEYLARNSDKSAGEESPRKVLASFCQALLSTAEFRMVD